MYLKLGKGCPMHMKTQTYEPLIWANFGGVLGLLAGLCAGILYAFGGLLIDIGVSLGWLLAETMQTPGLSIGTLYAFGALIGIPLIFALGGWLLFLALGSCIWGIVKLMP